MATRNLSEQVKVGLAAAAIVSAGIGFILARLRKRADDNKDALAYLEKTPVVTLGPYSFNTSQSFLGLLLLLALFGTVNYAQYDRRILLHDYDNYDLLHYYISAKYFDEIGYFNLLPALILADRESGEFCPGKATLYLAQNEVDYRRTPITSVYERADEIKSRFTEETWAEFVHDVTYIQRYNTWLTCRYWRQLLLDHGFNGTPVWLLIARPISRMIPVEYIKFAATLDMVWIIAMLYAVAWAFGRQTFLFAWIFITISYSFRWPTITWAFLRYDWLATMVIGVCMAKKERYATSGAFFAYATLMRYFPALWLFGIVAKGVHALINRRDIPATRFWARIPGKYYKMAAGFVFTVVVLVGVSIAKDGVDAHAQSLHNIRAHVEPHNLSSRRQGLVIALTYRGETEHNFIPEEKKKLVGEVETTVRVAAVLAMIAMGLFMSRLKDWEAVGLGAIPYFWLTTSSYYYYVLRMTLILVHARDLSKTRNLVGLFLLFAVELFCNASEHINFGNRYFLIGWMGVMLTIYSVAMVAFMGHEWLRTRKAAATE